MSLRPPTAVARAALLALLAVAGCAKSVAEWRADLSSEDPYARELAVIGLAESGQAEVVDDLCSVVRDPDPEVAGRAREALRRLAPVAVPRLVRALAGSDGDGQRTSMVAAEVLIDLGPTAVPLLVDALRDATPPQRKAVTLTLGRMDESGVRALAALLADPDAGLAVAAARALAASGEDARTALPELEQARLRPEPEVAAAANAALAALRAP